MLSTPEVAVGMSLPQKSLPKVPVFESTQFGRAVLPFEGSQNNARSCCIGRVSHLDTITNRTVSLDLDSLTSHTFVTGSTGSGKSNAVNYLLKGLINTNNAILLNPEEKETSKRRYQSVHFLVIEPAKGEYKDDWGGMRGCNVFGTNPNYTSLLKINPFSFPAGIHVMKHIDRLIEILNAIWPMYAAMRAILKDAIEKTYSLCGWNLLTSSNKFAQNDKQPLFPDFFDLLKVLPDVINKSEYSVETKGNYAGALLTRVHSLTNGYYRLIFQKDELGSDVLFDQNTIVDLSRVGASETKSLLMGLLFMKLQEYRMASTTTHNHPLKHVTVLEEAHHLLRKTSFTQGDEAANLQGKSVEMLTNAIAEMRTYGEGFIIADQAPGLLDPSVIRNTNTKIVFRLPDYDDRQLVGKSQHLSEEQITELSRLRTGCAAIYQNNWQEAVLCQFDIFRKEDLFGAKGFKPYKHQPDDICEDSRLRANKAMLVLLLKEFSKNWNYKPDNEKKWLLSLYYPTYLDEFGHHNEVQILWLLNEYFIKSIINSVPKTYNYEIWHTHLIRLLETNENVLGLSKDEVLVLRKATYKILAESDPNPAQRNIWLKLSRA
jgi:hypothetical protein